LWRFTPQIPRVTIHDDARGAPQRSRGADVTGGVTAGRQQGLRIVTPSITDPSIIGAAIAGAGVIEGPGLVPRTFLELHDHGIRMRYRGPSTECGHPSGGRTNERQGANGPNGKRVPAANRPTPPPGLPPRRRGTREHPTSLQATPAQRLRSSARHTGPGLSGTGPIVGACVKGHVPQGSLRSLRQTMP
jgi:hypothetical protein